MTPSIPVTVVTGFLGAGKSTLVEAWLRALPDEGRETAVIVNERGEVGIDGALLAARVARLREITGGCVCCTTQVELALALKELAESAPAPQRILVETSGAATPAGVVRALTRGAARERCRLDGIVTVVDASRLARTLRFPLTVEQLGFADVVVLSHTDACDAAAVARAADEAGRHAPGAVVARGVRGAVEVDGQAVDLLGLLARRAEVLRVFPDGALHDPAGIDAVSLVYDGDLEEERFADWVEAALGAVEARILRIKGILAMAGVAERVIVQGVGEAVEVDLGAPWGDAPRQSRLVVLGLGLDTEALEAGFAECVVADGTDCGAADRVVVDAPRG